MRNRPRDRAPIALAIRAVGLRYRRGLAVTRDKDDELADRITEADQRASDGKGRRGERLQVTIHEFDADAVVREKMEKALAEHVAAYPEDAGRTVKDFR